MLYVSMKGVTHVHESQNSDMRPCDLHLPLYADGTSSEEEARRSQKERRRDAPGRDNMGTTATACFSQPLRHQAYGSCTTQLSSSTSKASSDGAWGQHSPHRLWDSPMRLSRYPHFCLTGLQIPVPLTPSSGSVTWLEQLIELWEYSNLIYHFIVKDASQEQAHGRNTWWGVGYKALHAL